MGFFLLYIMAMAVGVQTDISQEDSRMGNRSVDCKTLVRPLDFPPVRSPQAVHTAVIPHFRGKDIVEIGTHQKGVGKGIYEVQNYNRKERGLRVVFAVIWLAGWHLSCSENMDLWYCG